MKDEAIKVLINLVDEGAIKFIEKNETEYERQYQEFLKNNNTIIGVDLAEGKDMTAYIPLKEMED